MKNALNLTCIVVQILDVVISQSESRNITVGNSEFRTDEDLSKNLFVSL